MSGKECIEKDCYQRIVDQSINALKEFIYLSMGSFEHVIKDVTRESKNLIKYIKQLDTFKDQLNEDSLKKDTIAQYNFINIANLMNQAQRMQELSPNSMLVSLMSGFEYYLKELLTIVCVEYPHAINCVDIKLDYNEFSLCNDKEEIRKHYINRFLEEFFRPSLKDVFETIEKKFKICKFKDITYYKDLLLIAEFRNIIVHNNGNAGLIFKARLQDIKISLDYEKYFHDKKLMISPDILIDFIKLMTVSAIEICIEFIDHYLPKGYPERDNYLYEINTLCIDFLFTSQKGIVLDVFTSIKKRDLSPDTKNFFIFNYLLSKKVVEKYIVKENDFSCIDWDYCDDTHHFAKYVLMGNYELAMSFCKSEEKDKWDEIFQIWPMCKPLVSSEVFKAKYKALFECEFVSKIIDWTNSKIDIAEAIDWLNNMLKNNEVNEDTTDTEESYEQREVYV